MDVIELPRQDLNCTELFHGRFRGRILRPCVHGATQNKLTGHANYQPVTSELLTLI